MGFNKKKLGELWLDSGARLRGAWGSYVIGGGVGTLLTFLASREGGEGEGAEGALW